MTSCVFVFAEINDGQKNFAIEEVSAEEFLARKNIGVSPIEPNIDYTIVPYGTAIPTEEHHIIDDGRYKFSGYAELSTLYTNYYFVGADEYWVKVTNHGTEDLTYKVKTRLKTYATRTVAPGDTDYAKVTGMTIESKIYILFYAPSDFSGYIEKY
jgi:hypothetical protein